jgi:ATP-dependent RNA helicase DDX18/HAS1
MKIPAAILVCASVPVRTVNSFAHPSYVMIGEASSNRLYAERKEYGNPGARRSVRADSVKRGGPSSRVSKRSDRTRNDGRSISKDSNISSNDFDNDPFGDFGGDDDYYNGDSGDSMDDRYSNDDSGISIMQKQQESERSSHFFSKKALSDPKFSIEPRTFQDLCLGAGISQPSRIQALAWPILLNGQSAIVADQTGSGKTLAYLLPLVQRMVNFDQTAKTKKEYGSPKVLVLAPTAELADQIKIVCDKTMSSMQISTRVITATGAHSTIIRDQIRMLGNTPVDILISTPGRIATILRTKNTTLNLLNLQAIVLDEVDVLMIDETFGPQLRTIGAASPVSKLQFVFVTATLPKEIVDSVKREFNEVEVIQGPGLHRVAPNLKEHLVDVSVPPSENNNLDLCFEYKAKELMKALRNNRCKRTLVFCNTVETCRKVENLIKRNDRRGRVFGVGAYHNAMTPEARRRNLSIFSKALDRELKGGKKEAVDHILICTDRAARGVDFDSAPVDHVIIFDFPKDPAEYVRRVGRTARAGRTGTSTVFAYAWQLPIARKIMGSKLESYTIAADTYNDNNEEFSNSQRQLKLEKKLKDQMIGGNIEQGKLWS